MRFAERLGGRRQNRSKGRRGLCDRRRRRRQFEILEPRVVLSANLDWAFDLPVGQGTGQAGGDHQVHVHEHAAHVLTFDSQCNSYYSEPVLSETSPDEGAGDGVVWQPYDLTETFSLHSNPGAEHTIYLDLDGHVTSGTAWNTSFTGGEDIVTPAWSADGDSMSFSDTEKATIQRIWARVAEDYAPFNVDVTTEEPSLDALEKASVGDTSWGIRVVIGPNTWYGSAGGVAYVGSFNWSNDTPAFVFNPSEIGIAEAASHEAGHTLGLGHDGDSVSVYYSGHGSGATGWAPIMGSSYSKALTQWSQGEYSDANNQQDDLAIIAGQNGFSYRADDYGNVFADAHSLLDAGQSQIDATYGIIEASEDIDTFTFLAGAGPASIHVDPFVVGANLDVMAELYDGIGTLIASSNPVDDIRALFDLNLAVEGQYFLQVSGTGKGDPLVDGYTDYGSLGNYRITGSVAAYSAGNSAPLANDDQHSTLADTPVTIDVLANDYDADGDPCILDSVTQGAHGTVVVNGDNTVTYTPEAGFTGVDVFSYVVCDGQDGQDTAQVTVTVSVPNLLVNGGFEDGLTGWETSGAVSTEAASFGEMPMEGLSQGLLTNENAVGGEVPVTELETYLDIGPGILDALAPGVATAGSAIRRTITVPADAELAFQYNFLTEEATPDATYNDFSFFTISGPGVEVAQVLGDTYAGTFGTSASIYSKSTGYQTVTFTFDQAGDYTIGFGVSDSQDTSYDSALLIDAVTLQESANTPPRATDDNAATAEDVAITIDVLANDTDADGDTIDVLGVTQGTHGMVMVNPDQTLTYTPDKDYHGTDSFGYTADDGRGGQSTAVVTVTIASANDAPTAADDLGAVAEDSSTTIDVLTNDTDVDGDALAVVAVTQGAHGSVVSNGDGTLSYTPVTNYHGTDILTYTVSDGQGGLATAAVTVTVNPVNDAPVAANDAAATTEDTHVTIDVLTNDTDIDGDELGVANVTQGVHGAVAINGDGTLNYTPDADFWGVDSFTYTVDDGNGGQATATVDVVVSPVVVEFEKFFVIDANAEATFSYTNSGKAVGSTQLASDNRDPRGVTSNAAGDTFWVVDKDKNVYLYDGNGDNLGKWKAEDISDKAQGIATDGEDLWIVDDKHDEVFFFDGGASLPLDQDHRPGAKFELDGDNGKPKGITTDGNYLWVVNDGRGDKDAVFKYLLDGTLVGRWQLDGANENPRGITIDPTGGSATIWVVDDGPLQVFAYEDGQSDSGPSGVTTFALAAGNESPEGIADPPPLLEIFHTEGVRSLSDPVTSADAVVGPTERTVMTLVERQDTAFSQLAQSIDAVPQGTDSSAERLNLDTAQRPASQTSATDLALTTTDHDSVLFDDLDWLDRAVADRGWDASTDEVFGELASIS